MVAPFSFFRPLSQSACSEGPVRSISISIYSHYLFKHSLIEIDRLTHHDGQNVLGTGLTVQRLAGEDGSQTGVNTEEVQATGVN